MTQRMEDNWNSLLGVNPREGQLPSAAEGPARIRPGRGAESADRDEEKIEHLLLAGLRYLFNYIKHFWLILRCIYFLLLNDDIQYRRQYAETRRGFSQQLPVSLEVHLLAE